MAESPKSKQAKRSLYVMEWFHPQCGWTAIEGDASLFFVRRSMEKARKAQGRAEKFRIKTYVPKENL